MDGDSKRQTHLVSELARNQLIGLAHNVSPLETSGYYSSLVPSLAAYIALRIYVLQQLLRLRGPRFQNDCLDAGLNV